MPATIQVGTGCVDITPPVGVDLCGFAGRASANVGVHDPLFAKAVVLDDGQTAWAILTSDLIGVSSEIVGAVREQAQEQAGIPAAHVMVTASHTHSGPHTSVLRGMGEADGHYVEVLTRKLAGVVQLAANARRKAAVGWRRGAVQLGVNRRERTAEGAVRLGSNPVGPVAAYVDVLSAFDDDGRPRAVLFSHAAHPVVLRADNLLVSADYPGYAQSLVARAWPTGPTALFAQGCCGNINVGPRGSFDDARQAGEVLGAEVVKCVQNTMPVERARLGAATRTVELPLADPPPREEAEEQVRRLRAELDGAISRGENRGQILWKKGLVAWAEDLL
ncbi:MAG: neutral/alkaline non-lysosomal ceramidase N-terminal domain-containing protein, partial [Armatimonadota bacterium]